MGDVRLIACTELPHCITFTRGFSEMVALAGVDEIAGLQAWMSLSPYMTASRRWPGDEKNLRLCTLAIEICRDPSGLSELELAGVWWLVFQASAQRDAVLIAACNDLGLFLLAMATLHKSEPTEWINWRSPQGLIAGAIMVALCQVSNAQAGLAQAGLDVTKLVVDSGVGDMVGQMLTAYEQRGSAKVDEGNVLAYVHALLLIQNLDLSAANAEPIITMLQKLPSALRFTLKHPLEHIKAIGFTSTSTCATICALALGKEEAGGGFDFTQELCNDILAMLQDFLSGSDLH